MEIEKNLNMRIKTGVRYVAGSDSETGEVLKGDIVTVRKETLKDFKYCMFLPVHGEGMTFFGMPQLNNVLYFKTKEDVQLALNGTSLVIDKEFGRELLSKAEKEIEKLKEQYEL